jgi:aldehyde:ferredoxin oxidoreductase
MVSNGEKCLQAIFALKNKFNSSSYTKDYLPNQGNAFLLNICLEKKILPANNFIISAEKVENLDAESASHLTNRSKSCFSCPIGCLRFFLEKESRTLHLDYEAISGFGYLCRIKSLKKFLSLGVYALTLVLMF